MTMKEKIVAMQVRKTNDPDRSDVFQHDDGTWGHCMSFHAGFADKTTAQTDLRFCREWTS